MNRFKEKEIRILKALAKYKYLSYAQMLRLKIQNYKSNLSTGCGNLLKCKPALINKISHGDGYPSLWYLTPKGGEYLEREHGLEKTEIAIPLNKTKSDSINQRHTYSMINCLIELQLACEELKVNLEFSDFDFDRIDQAKNRKKHDRKNSILWGEKKSIVPDLIFKLSTERAPELYLLEVENGNHSSKSFDKCLEHREAIFLKSANTKYDFQSGYRTLWVFEKESTMKLVIEKLKKDERFNNLIEYFLFKTIVSIKDNFFEGWVNIDSKPRKLFYL